MVQKQGTVNGAIVQRPLMVVKPPIFIAILQQIDIKTGPGEDIDKQPVVIDGFVIRGRMIAGTGTPDARRFLI